MKWVLLPLYRLLLYMTDTTTMAGSYATSLLVPDVQDAMYHPAFSYLVHMNFTVPT